MPRMWANRMEMRRATLETCARATGAVVVVDVIRAFTTAAYAFSAGARDIVLVSTVDEAFAVQKRTPDSLLMGEVGGRPIQGFDFGNSPSELARQDLSGRRLIQRTSRGTQGVVRSVHAQILLAASFVCARATALYLRRLSPPSVTFVVTGVHAGDDGDEDTACADYITALLRDETSGVEPFLDRVRQSTAGRRLSDPAFREYPAADLPYCLAADDFDFVMRAKRSDGLMILAVTS